MKIVAKFGGSSVSSAEQFRKVKEIMEDNPCRRIAVVSAVGKKNPRDSKMTDLLYLTHAHLKYSVPYDNIWKMIVDRFIDIKKELGLAFPIEEHLEEIRKCLSKTISLDYLVSRGEYLTGLLMAEYLGFKFVDAKSIITFDYDGKINYEKTKEKYDLLCTNDEKILVPGFYGALPNGEIKLLSRGGSDITGSILARVSESTMYENWTDVSGILAADPRIVENPAKIKQITYIELRELSYMGANVLHEETIFPVQEVNIPINIRNTNAKNDEGTIIQNHCDDNTHSITGIAGKKYFTSFTITKAYNASKTDIIYQILAYLKSYHIRVEQMPSSIDTFSIVVESEAVKPYLYDLIALIKKIDGVLDISIDEDIALVAIVGRNMASVSGISGKVLTFIGQKGINIKLLNQGAEEINIIVGIQNKDLEETIKTLYDNLF